MRYPLVYIALVLAVFGVLLLSYAQDRITPPSSRVGDLSYANIGDNVRIIGNVTGVHEFSGGSLSLTVSDDTGSVDVFIPYYVAEKIGKNPKTVEVVGGMKYYRGGRELVVEDQKNIVILE